jgi:hypothetical protein
MEIARNSPAGKPETQQSARRAYPSDRAGSMAARARSESGGAAELRIGGRGSHEARRGWRPAEGRDEDEVETEARDGALSNLACMLPETVARVQPGV